MGTVEGSKYSLGFLSDTFCLFVLSNGHLFNDFFKLFYFLRL